MMQMATRFTYFFAEGHWLLSHARPCMAKTQGCTSQPDGLLHTTPKYKVGLVEDMTGVTDDDQRAKVRHLVHCVDAKWLWEPDPSVCISACMVEYARLVSPLACKAP